MTVTKVWREVLDGETANEYELIKTIISRNGKSFTYRHESGEKMTVWFRYNDNGFMCPEPYRIAFEG